MNTETVIRYLTMAVVVVTSLPVHELAHGLTANWLGDHTAKDQGRLTLNPFAHLDLFGTLALLLFGFGWAKPVPINPSRFKKPKRDMALTALHRSAFQYPAGAGSHGHFQSVYVLWQH